MEQRISLLTLGARDPARLAAFYDALGWTRVETEDGVVAYDLIGQTLGIYSLEKLADDIGVDVATMGHGAATFGFNTREKEDVAALLTLAQAAGGKVLKAACDVFWGGHHGYFADPEGHLWEVAFNPFSPVNAAGEFRWNGHD